MKFPRTLEYLATVSLAVVPATLAALNQPVAAILTGLTLLWAAIRLPLRKIFTTLQEGVDDRIKSLPPLFRGLAEMQRSHFEGGLRLMERGEFVHHATAPQSELAKTFSHIMREVQNRFETITVPQFWSERNMGGAALDSYIEENLAIVGRGGTVTRYIVLEDDDFSGPSIPASIRVLLLALKRAESRLASDPQGTGSLRTHILRRSMLPRSWDPNCNFAIWDDHVGNSWLVDMHHITRQDGVTVFGHVRITRLDEDPRADREFKARLEDARQAVAADESTTSLDAAVGRLRNERTPASGSAVQVRTDGGDSTCATPVDQDSQGGLGLRIDRNSALAEGQYCSIADTEGGERAYTVAWRAQIGSDCRIGLTPR